MIHPLIAFLSLFHVVQGTSTNTTGSSCPPHDGPTRSLWSIPWSCALTLLICVWHIAHPGVPEPKHYKWYNFQRYRRMLILVIWCFSSPEVIVAIASYERLVAEHICKKFREKEFAYEWSMAHSHLAQMGGFVYHAGDEGDGLRAIGSLEFLDLCEKKEIINANITKEDIMDKSKSDLVGKAVYGVQLLWFILQVAVRHFNGLAITLIELDTVAMAVLSLLIIGLWLDKPLRPKRPYVFHSPKQVGVYPQPDLISEWKWFPRDPVSRTSIAFSALGPRSGVMAQMMVAFLGRLSSMMTRMMATFSHGRLLPSWTTRISQHQSERDARVAADSIDLDLHETGLHLTIVLCVTWIILGGIHLMAWDADFPRQKEKILWRVASLVLTGLPLTIVVAWGFLWALEKLDWCNRNTVTAYTHGVVINLAQFGFVIRLLLAGLMLASLRAVPCSAHQTISWTDFIPHL